MLKSSILILAALFLSATFAEADVGLSPEKVSVTSLTSGKEKLPDLKQSPVFKGVFDASRFSFQNTVGMSFSSGALGGFSQYYLNTITYNAAKPLIIQAQVGVENTSYGSPTIGPSSRGGNVRIVVPYLRALYRPRPNIQIEIQFSNQPSYYRYRGGYPY